MEITSGEAVRSPVSDEVNRPQDESDNAGQGLLERAFARENLKRAWKRVKANKGAAGVDGLDIERTAEHLLSQWPKIREQLLSGAYRPGPVKRVVIPKPDGGERELGIPTVTDRLIQQALLQIVQPLVDPTFSEHSYGFRPGRRAQDAVLAAQRYVSSGREVVVDVDLEKFFDRVDHDILMDRLRKRILDRAVIRLIRTYLDAGTMINGVVEKSRCGAPQGGPLSPFLANVLLDEVDRELERRGHCFVRYADDANVYVRSHKAGLRVMTLLRRLYEKLHLSVNESKSAVTSAFGRKFLGYEFWSARGDVKRAVSYKALKQFKQRIRWYTRRSCGRGLQQIADELRPYILGWKAYFGLSQTPAVWRELDEWLRHRLRAIQLKQWKRGTTTYRELRALGASNQVAQKVAGNTSRWWHNSRLALNRVLTIAWFDRLGLVRLS
ncbi:group II intron reverse transcriptase/maturase [Pseudomonas sp. BE134]|uniref:group II intron reverse transcriptase/maturase n=1 Tax=Pseudomonas sp. BE134 TaxID=2817843 RepID=UPI00285D9CBC|nr:group II intron reverse transcriptase/maturase [Pseudomonas sp. BE134]MDR6924624.1 group II intron reverse transcriptase/maturase [Pseudomonas sp. BE134]